MCNYEYTAALVNVNIHDENSDAKYVSHRMSFCTKSKFVLFALLLPTEWLDMGWLVDWRSVSGRDRDFPYCHHHV
jgi:hypothetical protein